MRRLLATASATALLAFTLPALAAGQAIDPGTPTTIAPDTPTDSDGSTGVAPAPGDTTTPDGAAPGATGTEPAPPATGTTPAPTETAPAATAQVPPPATPTPPPAAPQPAPAAESASDDAGGGRAGLAVLIVLGALVLLLAVAWAVARWQGVEPPWWPRARHSLAEFGWRASGAWSDFTDWVRLGR